MSACSFIFKACSIFRNSFMNCKGIALCAASGRNLSWWQAYGAYGTAIGEQRRDPPLTRVPPPRVRSLRGPRVSMIDLHVPMIELHVPMIDLHVPMIELHVPMVDLHVPMTSLRVSIIGWRSPP